MKLPHGIHHPDEEGVRIMEEAFRKKIQEIELGRPPVD